MEVETKFHNEGTFAELPAVSVGEAICLFFTRYVDFKTRSRRSEYWTAMIAVSVVSGILNLVFGKVPMVSTIWSLAVLLPSIAVTVRRLHDTGKSGWHYLWNLLPIVGQIILLVFLIKDSDPDENQWGKSPKYQG